jgi:hypothetical protein
VIESILNFSTPILPFIPRPFPFGRTSLSVVSINVAFVMTVPFYFIALLIQVEDMQCRRYYNMVLIII